MVPLVWKQSLVYDSLWTIPPRPNDWLLIHPFFWKECLIIIPISTRPVRSCKARQSRFCTPASQACQIKRVCQWHFEDGSPETEEKKDELCKISLNIALQRSTSHMPAFSSRRQSMNWNDLTAAKCSSLKFTSSLSIPCYHCEQCRMGSCGLSKRKALGDKEEGDDRRVIEWDLHLESDNIRGS